MINSQTRKRPFSVRPWLIVLATAVIYLGVIYFYNGSSVFEFIFPKQAGATGYDGQFTYYIARDPVNAASLIKQLNDFPAYRYQRILSPLLARLLSLGRDDWLPWVMLLIDLAALAIGTAALERLLIEQGVSRWHALTYGLFGGVFVAVRVTTTEPLAFGLVLLAVLAGQRGQLIRQAILLALAALAKSPALFFVAGYLVYFLLSRRRRDAIRLAVIALLPFAAWLVFLFLWLGDFGIISGGAGATGFEIIPFNGIWRIAVESPALFVYMGPYLIAGVLLPTVWALWRAGLDVLRRRWHPYVFLLLVNAAIIPFVPFSTFREPLGISRFLPGLVISFVLYAAARGGSQRPLIYSSLWIFWSLKVIG